MEFEFRAMRRAKQQLSDAQAEEILDRGSSGVLALLGEGEYPYALPISYVYSQGKLFFHSALTGHKIDALRAHGKASFCVVAQDDVLPEQYTSAYKSAIAFGRVRVIEDEGEKRRVMRLLGDKYNPGHMAATVKAVEDSLSQMHLIELEIEHVSAKCGKALL